MYLYVTIREPQLIRAETSVSRYQRLTVILFSRHQDVVYSRSLHFFLCVIIVFEIFPSKTIAITSGPTRVPTDWKYI